MTQDERIEESAENRYKTVPEKTKWICKDSFKDGWKACVNQEEWKNLYGEGVTVGLNLRKAISEKWKYVEEHWPEIAKIVTEEINKSNGRDNNN